MIKIQQEMMPDLKQPWSVIFAEDGEVIYGRPDATHIVGFGPKGTHEITLTTALAHAQPELIVGKVPTFIGHGGDMFSVDLAVKSAEPYEADEAAVAELVKREAEYRRIIIEQDDEED